MEHENIENYGSQKEYLLAGAAISGSMLAFEGAFLFAPGLTQLTVNW